MTECIQRYDRGYRTALTKEQIGELKGRFSRPSAAKATAITLVYSGSIFLTAAATHMLLESRIHPAFKALTVCVAVVLIVRQLRSLENVVHFASHLNFSRKRNVNDWLANVLAAWPTLSDVRMYRIFHQQHHGRFGSHADPCRMRFERMGVSDVDLSSGWALSKAVLRWLLPYVREYYREVGTRRRELCYFVTWHAVVALGLTLLVSWDYAVLVTAVWMTAMFVFLPIVRSIAEVGEHDYNRGVTELDTTFNNLGLWDQILLHPAGDAWHILHHLYPSIPWWRQRRAHQFLMEHDDAYQHALHRTSMLSRQTEETRFSRERLRT